MEEVSDILTKAGFDEEVVKVFRVNKIDRSLLVALDKDDMKELGIVALGDRKKLQMLITTLLSGARQTTETLSSTSRSDLPRPLSAEPGSVNASPSSSDLIIMAGDNDSILVDEVNYSI